MNFNIQGLDHHHHHHNHIHDQNRADDDDDDHESGGSSSTTTRSYDCVFCQRGFTTAQALGGHMNIHRKDRTSLANPKHPISSPNPPTNCRLPTTISSKQVGLEEDEEDDNNNYAANTRLFYSSSPPAKGYFGPPYNLGAPSSFGARFSQYGSGSQVGHSGSGKKVRDHDHHSQEEEELDLELRLGYYPW